MTRQWTIDAVHRVPLRLTLLTGMDGGIMREAQYQFFKSLEPMARFNFLAFGFYSIIERGGA